MEREVTSNDEHLIVSEFKDDYIVKSIGAFGPWQARICIIAALVRSTGIWNMLSIVFLTPKTEFSCVKFKTSNVTLVKNSTCYENCVKYEFHEDVMFEKNLISEFNLVCDSAWKAGFTQTLIMFGSLIGVSLFGWISDRFGRRIGLIISTSINLILMIVAPLSPSYWIFNGIRFLIGITTGGVMVISLVLIIEIVGPQYREAAGSLSMISDGFAQALLSAFAYFAVDWKMYLLEYGILSIFIYMLIISLSETPRWFMAKGRVKKALDVMTKAAER
ncbi:unnamed protein product [Arctia plantaginis]|uniref:Major facilitator superfamily (MFS) profile domain-containing protein n=1 Tax=Arctia plantaginis TaxID=874455 RepID=A0A8S1BD80_ARCPL|nr:unnamed protein product [Arctia plantaginis]